MDMSLANAVCPPASDHKIKHEEVEVAYGDDSDGSKANQPGLEDKPDDLDVNREASVMTSKRGLFSWILDAFSKVLKVDNEDDEDDDDDDAEKSVHEYHNEWDDDTNNNVRAAPPPSPPVYNWDIIPPPLSIYTGYEGWDWDSSDEFDNTSKSPPWGYPITPV